MGEQPGEQFEGMDESAAAVLEFLAAVGVPIEEGSPQAAREMYEAITSEWFASGPKPEPFRRTGLQIGSCVPSSSRMI